MIDRTAGISVAGGTVERITRSFRRVEAKLPVEHLRCRHVDLRLALALEAAHPDVADHADDRPHRERHRELLADRIAIRKVLARKRSAHDRHARRVERIIRADIAPLQDRRADRGEESRRDKANAHVARVAKVGSHESPRTVRIRHRRQDLPDAAPERHRQEADVGRVGHARKRVHFPKHALIELLARGRQSIPGHRQHRPQRQHVGGLEAGIDGLHAQQCLDQQADRHEQHDRRDDFGDDEPRAKPLGAAAGAAAGALFQGRSVCRAARSQRRQHAKHQARGQREQAGAEQHPEIDRRHFRDRQRRGDQPRDERR